MKRFLLLPLTGLIFSFLFSTSEVKAQLDSTVFDYDAFTSCFACGDNLAYNVNGTKDSLTDATPSTHFLSSLKVKYKMFSCYSGTLSLTLNGTTVGTATAAYNCACNACDTLVFNISAANIKTYYKYGQKNVFRLVSPSSGLYMDRCVIYRVKSKKSNYDAGIVSVDSPAVYVCPSSRSIKLTINNGGRKAFTGVDVAWKWNGTSQTTVTHSGTLDTTGGSGSNTAQITLGTKTFTKGKKDTLMAWTRNPGGIVDSTNFNDTVRHIFYGSYGDTIRIGGSSPHYTTIQAAVNALMSNGVCAPVYIKLWPGTYNEQVTINNIPGTSTSNFIMFLSKNNDSATTVINYSASSSLNYTVRLNNVKNILFHRITIEALNSTYGTVVSMIGGIENISFNRCALLGVATTSSGSSQSVINRSYTNVSDNTLNLVFTQSRIHQGSIGMYLNNSYSNYLYGFYIRNCVFENQSYMNLQCSYAKNIGISNNLFDRNASSVYYGYGILLQYTEDSMTIVSNRIIQRNGGIAFYIYNATGKSSKRNLIANNFISVYSPITYSGDYGIYNYYNQYTDFVNNSILRHSASTDGYAFSLEEGSNNRVWYNNVENKNQGKAFYIYSGSNNSVLKSDRNNFYNGGADIGYWYGNTIKTITDIKTKVQQDSNSISNDPNFSSTTDLHAYGVDLDGRARPYSGITKDIDGETRNATTPDIGADEFNLLALDIGVVDVLPTLTGTNCLKVVLRNMGTTNVTSAKIDWKINGVAKTQINWSGSLAKGDTDIVCLGNILFKRDTLYTLVAWSSAPNTGTDLLKSNDTLDENFYPAMNGIYTIGGTTPDFASFGTAVSSLSNAGLIDSVYFKVRNGTYTEQIELGDIDGANHKNSIIFESESKDSSKVILQYATSAYSNNFVVYLNGAKGVTFRKMTLQNQTASSYRTVVLLNNRAENSRFENNVIQNNDSTSTSYYSSLVKMEYNQGSDINFIQNIFNKGSYGFYFYGNSSGRDNGVKIQKNIFKKQSYQPLYLYYLKNIEISNNTVTSTSNNVNSGLSFGYFEGAASVFNNKIDISGSNAYYGMYIYGFYSSTDTFRLYNNFITVGGTTSGMGIYLSDIYPGTIYYNNVLNNCKDSSSSSAAFNFSGGNLKVHNNNFIHKANGYSIYTSYIDDFKSNYNNLYSNGTKYVYWDGVSYSTLNAYSSAEDNDTSSVEVDPIYVSSSDLHVSFAGINAKGKPISGITKDIDGETRNSSTPDIGADEFTPLAIDAGVSKIFNPGDIFRPANTNVEVVVTNFGVDTLKTVTVQIKINNDTLPRKKITRNIKSGDTIHVKLGNYLFKADTLYDFWAYTFLPNGITDPKKSNDTLKILDRLPALSGVYTIGGTTPNFPTFKAAVNALKKAGIADSVRFRVRAGTYTEQISIPPIGGAGARNSIIFESQDFDSTSVILKYSPAYYDTNYVVQLNGADGITFRYMTIQSTSTGSYSGVFEIRGRALNNTIYKNIVVGPNSNSSSTYYTLIYSGQNADDNLHIKNNIFKNGSYAMYLYGYSGVSPYVNEKGLEISNNTIHNPYYYGIYLSYCDSTKVLGNNLYSNKYTYFYGISVEYCQNINISNNKLNLQQGYMGLYMYQCGNYFKRSLISNNSIYLKNTSTTPYGIYCYSSYYNDFIHNSVNIDNPYSSSRALIMYYGSNNNLYNNIFANSGTGYSVYINNSSSLTNSNRNDLFTNGSILGYWNGSNATDLSAWKTATSKDTNSISINPVFKAINDLHAKEVSLNGAAKYFKLVPLDFDNETRDTLKPDIGADEFQLPPNDAGISKILLPNKPFPADTQKVKVVIKNYGGNPLYVATINWKFNGVTQTAISWADTLLAGDTMHVKLAKKFFHPDSGYSVTAWTTNPNGTTDSIPLNDTSKVINQYPALSGVYTIGGAAPDFATFDDAVIAMKRGGIIDSVRFDVRNGTYYEQIDLPYIHGANKENAIIFQSEAKDSSKVVISAVTSSSKNFTVRIDSTNGVTFRYLTITTTGTYYYNRIFEILDEAKNINIHDCNIIGKANNSTGENEALIYYYNTNSSRPGFDNIEIYRNRLRYGSFGITGYGYSSVSYAKDLNFHDNNMEDQYYMGLYFRYFNNFKINNNDIYRGSASGYSNGFGIYAQYGRDGFEITNNHIYNQEYYGVYMYECYGKAQDTSLFANNFIHCRTNSNTYGVIIYYSDYLNFFNNNINLTSTNTTSYSGFFYSPSRTSVINNNFTHSGLGYAIYQNGTLTRSDYNNLFTNGSILAQHNSTNRADLAAWKSSTGKDTKSLSVDPDYVSSTDLHVRETDLNAAGRNHKYLIKTDFDGQKRDTITPDIGADEFDIPAGDDAGISAYVSPVAPFAAGSTAVKVIIKNYGSDSLKTATVKWRVNGTLQTSYSWTGALKTGQSATITIGNFNFLSGKKHDMQFWTTDPNGVADTTNYNDSLKKLDVYPALDGVYTVGNIAPDFVSLTEAFLALKLGGSIDTVWFKVRSGTYNHDLIVESYPGAHPKRPVYIEAETGDSSDVVITNSGGTYGTYLIYIKGADYLRFKKITFRPVSSYGQNAVRYDNISKGLSFENCHFDLTNSATSYYYYNSYAIFSNSDKDDSLTVQNCRFDRGTYGIYTYSGSGNETGINLNRNLFINQTGNGIYVRYADAAKIRYNKLSNSLYAATAINLYYTGLDLTVSHNNINCSVAGSVGVYIYNHSGSSGSKANIFNNFISVNGASSSPNALQLHYSTYVNIFYNSVNTYGTNTAATALYLYGGNNFDIRNNVFANTGGGYSLFYNGSPSISQSNYNDLFTSGTNLGNFNGSIKTTLAAWKTASGKDANSLSLNPTFNSDVDLHTNLSSLDSACLPISGITDDIDLETRNSSKPDIGADEFQSLPENLGISAFITPVNSCNLDSSFIKVRIFNYGNKSQVGFPVRYKIDGGTIKTGTVTDTIKPGKDIVFQFATKEPFVVNTSYIIQSWTDLSTEKYRVNDSLKITFINYQKPDSVKNMVPADGSTGIDFPFTLSWAPSTGATRYDVYVWPFASSKPSTPTLANTTQISYQITGSLTYGDKYNWQIEAKNPICFTPGKVQTFTMKHLPDLIVEEVNAPNTAFSSNTISVSWKIKNTGQGNASGSWYDAIYLSNDGVLDITDLYLGAVVNPSALNASQNYTQSASVTLPNGISGNYYIFISTDQYGNISESSNSNNSARDTGKMVVSLTPPPDLIVTSVSRPSVVFSGSSTNSVTYVIKNKGTGPTRSGLWYDGVYLSTEKVVNGSSYLLAQSTHSGNLNVDSTYSVTKNNLTIPNYISGKYFFVVVTDLYNHEYEHASESNNSKGSDTIKVLLTPPPDLITKNLTAVDTASNSESILVKYHVINDGGSSTNGAFYDGVFLSPTSTFNPSTAIALGTVYHNALPSKDTSKVSQNFTIPKTINGTYYLFAFADYYGYINEVTNEGNNGNSGHKIVIISPDLKVSRVIVSSTDTTGSATPVSWTVKNHGLGDDFQGNRTDSIYISKFASWSRSNSTPIGSLRYSTSLLKDDTLDRSTIVRIPDGFDGNRYFFVVTDAAKEVYEPGRDTNNYKRSNLMNVILAPYPDLLPKFNTFPDSAKAGGLISFFYKVKNQGEAKANPNWKDKYYFSKDSVFNLTKVFLLSENSRTTALDVQGSYEKTVFMTLPASMAKGNYYYYIFTDADKEVYEHLNDSNNIVRTKKIFIDGYPPVDLRVNCPEIVDTMWSGNSYKLSYSVTNIGQAKTAVGAWNDAAYLSTDSILNTGDLLISTINISKALDKDSSYKIGQTIVVPNGMSGDFYLLVKTDITKLIIDIDSTNNKKAACKSTGGAKKIRINFTPPPDLRITLWDIPSTGTSGQPLKIKWKVENKGTGATRSGTWMDQFYLSTDYTIDNSDYPLGEKRHTGNLAVNGNYNDSQEFNIPLDKVGNYIVILKTDGANVEYEYTNEGNNVVSSVTNLTKAPPADLIVSQVTSPDSVLSGKSINVTWKVKNKGSNPASGSMTDNIYLSADNKQDASDLLLASEHYSISIAPNTEISKSRTLSVSGVAIGNYYVLVSADVLNNINESYDTNNTNTAANHLNVNVPLLPIAVKTKDTLSNGEKIYYRIEIPSNLVGESMLITLKADSTKGNNEIFVRHQNMVSGSEFDYKYREPFKGNQEIIIPELQEGTYYLMTTGQKTGTPNYQQIILFARIMPFEIRKVTPATGGNTGEVTVLIEGSKLEEGVQFFLLDSLAVILPIDSGEFSAGNSRISSINVKSIDPTQAYVTFNLAGKALGYYDVVALKGVELVKLKKGFKVVPGTNADLNITVARPGNMRTNNIASMNVIFSNSGNTDLINQKIIITSNAGAPIALNADDLSKNYTSLEIIVQENVGPSGRLRPGGSGSVLIYTKASAALGFTILK